MIPKNDYELRGDHYALFLNRGTVLLDLEDLVVVAPYRWHNSNGYARTMKPDHSLERMHLLLLPRRPGFVTDHVNGNKLDNRKDNLRYVTHSENMYNYERPGISGIRYITVINAPKGPYYKLLREVNQILEYGGSSYNLDDLLPLQQQWEQERLAKLSNAYARVRT